VGPGYNDSLIRPWNTHNEKARDGGRYYDDMWAAAVSAAPEVVSVTSWNEWGEGTQVEPACARLGPAAGGAEQEGSNTNSGGGTRRYAGYGQGDGLQDDEAAQFLYVDLTRRWRDRLQAAQQAGAEL